MAASLHAQKAACGGAMISPRLLAGGTGGPPVSGAMISPRQIGLRLLGVIVVYSLLMALSPLLAPPMTRFIALTSDVLFKRPGWDARASFRSDSDERGPMVAITITHSTLKQSGSMAIGVRERAYMSLAILISLITMSPVPSSRKLRAFAISIGLLVIFIFAAMWLSALNAVASWPQNAFGLHSYTRAIIHWLYLYAAEVPMTVLVVPLILWAACTFRREDFAGEEKGAEPTASRRFSTERHRNP